MYLFQSLGIFYIHENRCLLSSFIETKIANGELGGGGGDNTGGGTVDLTPVNNRLTALETKDTAHENRLEALETAKTTQASKISELESAHTTIDNTLETLNGTVSSLQNSLNITDSEGNVVTVATAFTEAKAVAATAQTIADTASTTASAAKATAESATTAATSAQATANEAKALVSVTDVQYNTIVTTLSEDGQTVVEMTLTTRGENDPDLTIAQLFNKLFANQAAIMTAINTYNKFNTDLQSDLGTFMTELKAQLQIVGSNY